MRVLIAILILLFVGCSERKRSQITKLDLSNQKLSIIPDSVFSLTNLTYLQLGNSFTFYPPLSALGADMPVGDSLNRIVEISGSIENLQHLRYLCLRCNDLRSLPEEIVKLERLDSLDLSFNENLSISIVSETLEKMHSLKYLNIVATESDSVTVDNLRKSLPKTKIISRVKDLLIDEAAQ